MTRLLCVLLVGVSIGACASTGYYRPKNQTSENLSAYVKSAALARVDGQCVAVLAYQDGQVSRLPVKDAVCATAKTTNEAIAAVTKAAAPAAPKPADPAK